MLSLFSFESNLRANAAAASLLSLCGSGDDCCARVLYQLQILLVAIHDRPR
jgi:hypothetical protein